MSNTHALWESYLKIHGRRVPIEAFEPGRRVIYAKPMPEDLMTLIRSWTRFDDWISDLDEVEDDAFEALWESTVVAFEVLREDGLVEGSWESWNGHELCAAIIQVVARGMAYVWRPLTEALSSTAAPARRYGRIVYRVQVFELMFVSLLKGRLDYQCPIWLAGQPLTSDLTGMCRHYAKIARVLFVAAQKTTGRWQDWEVLRVNGQISHSSFLGHAWNWLVDYRQGVVYAFDITSADWEVDRNNEESIFNRRLDATRFPNRSSFMGMLFWANSTTAYPTELLDQPSLVRALSTLIDVRDDDDLMVLHTLAHNRILVESVARSINELIREHILFENDELQRGDTMTSKLAADIDLQKQLLAAIVSAPDVQEVQEPDLNPAPLPFTIPRLWES